MNEKSEKPTPDEIAEWDKCVRRYAEDWDRHYQRWCEDFDDDMRRHFSEPARVKIVPSIFQRVRAWFTVH